MLLLTKAFIPKDIQEIIIGSDFAVNLYEYIPLKKLDIYPRFLNGFEFSLSTSSLNSFGVDYDSTILNSYSALSCIFFMILFHLCIWILKLLFSWWRNRRGCFIKGAIWLVDLLFDIMTFGYYIRNYLELSQFILISSVNEIYQLNTSETLRLISFIYAILMIALFAFVLIVINYLIFSQYEINDEGHNKLEEFFSWLQVNKKPRFYVTMLLLRRLFFVSLLISLQSISSRALIGLMMFIQFVYGVYIILVRPYKETKCNFIEILNEAYFSLFLVTLMIFNTQNEWNSINTNIYVWVLVSNSVLVFLIVLGINIFN